MPVMILWTNDVQIFLNLHAFLHADSGIGICPNALFTNRKKTRTQQLLKSLNLTPWWIGFCGRAGGRCPALRGIPIFQRELKMNILNNDQEKRST